MLRPLKLLQPAQLNEAEQDKIYPNQEGQDLGGLFSQSNLQRALDLLNAKYEELWPMKSLVRLLVVLTRCVTIYQP